MFLLCHHLVWHTVLLSPKNETTQTTQNEEQAYLFTALHNCVTSHSTVENTMSLHPTNTVIPTMQIDEQPYLFVALPNFVTTSSAVSDTISFNTRSILENKHTLSPTNASTQVMPHSKEQPYCFKTLSYCVATGTILGNIVLV